MSLVFNLFKAWFAGIVLFFAIPVTVRALPWEYRKGTINQYFSMAMGVLGRGVMLKRSHGGYKLKKTSFDTKTMSEKTRLGGEDKHWQDPHHYMATFRGYPFGLAHEDRNVIWDARLPELARRFADLKRNGEWTIEKAGETYRKAYFQLTPGEEELVNLDDALPALGGTAKPGLADRVEVYIEKSQMLFNSQRFFQITKWLIPLGAGFGLMYLGAKLQSTTGGSTGGSVVPIMVDVTGVLF